MAHANGEVYGYDILPTTHAPRFTCVSIPVAPFFCMQCQLRFLLLPVSIGIPFRIVTPISLFNAWLGHARMLLCMTRKSVETHHKMRLKQTRQPAACSVRHIPLNIMDVARFSGPSPARDVHKGGQGQRANCIYSTRGGSSPARQDVYLARTTPETGQRKMRSPGNVYAA